MRSVFVLLAIVSISSCGGGSNNSASESVLFGAWFIPCVEEEDAFGSKVYAERELVFEVDIWSSNSEFFSDASCQLSEVIFTSSGIYKIGEYLVSSEGINVRGITLTELASDGSIIDIDDGVYHIENEMLFLGTYDEVTGIPTLEFGRVWQRR